MPENLVAAAPPALIAGMARSYKRAAFFMKRTGYLHAH